MNIIVRPVITEKSMMDAGKGKFTFVVATEANKHMIRQAIKDAFKVTVLGVSTRMTKGKTKRTGTRRMEVQGSSFKKAVVTLKQGEKIDLFEIGA